MRKIIASFNTTIDGNCDHTAGMADEELHQHYTALLDDADTILYGRTTYQLMEYWRTILEKPVQDKAMNDFAKAIDKIQKIVFSHTLKHLDWNRATLASRNLEDEVSALKQQSGKDILVGSRSVIIQLLNLNLIDELQLCIQPVIAGAGLSLFEDIADRTIFSLKKTKTFNNGAIILYYQPTKKMKTAKT